MTRKEKMMAGETKQNVIVKNNLKGFSQESWPCARKNPGEKISENLHSPWQDVLNICDKSIDSLDLTYYRVYD